MCGICGIVRSDNGVISASTLTAMQSAITHRGPDDRGQFFQPGIGLGFQRLAILDLTSLGHQPMSTPDGHLTIVFNGEIYNHHELRDDLVQRGYTFRSRTDTEVILHGYHAFGLDIFKRLSGMFALAIWDNINQQMLFARDRLGKKPLFYTINNQTLYFASELSAFWKVLSKPPINESVLPLYFRGQSIPGPETIFQDVYQLPPATIGRWQNGQLTTSTYWSVPASTNANISDEQAENEFDRLFRQAVRQRLEADVPLGLFLSGGLDSSILAAVMSQEMSQPVKTFSIGFAEQSHNELPLARLVADKFGTDHHELVISANIHERLPALLKNFGQPFADSSALAVAAVAEETRKHVTVALNGDGGDENFAGYEKYPLLLQAQSLDRLPVSVRSAISTALHPALSLLPTKLRRKLIVANTMFGEAFVARYLDTFFTYTKRGLESLLSPDLLKHTSLETLLEQRLGRDLQLPLLPRTSLLDYTFYLPETLLVKSDIATMSVSLEARSPFLDHRLVEFTSQLPDRMKRRNGQSKWLLRKTYGHLLPLELLRAPKKGFDLPVNTWLQGEVLTTLQQRLQEPSFVSLPWFNHQTIATLLHEHRSGHSYHGNRLWSLYCFVVWYQEQYL